MGYRIELYAAERSREAGRTVSSRNAAATDFKSASEEAAKSYIRGFFNADAHPDSARLIDGDGKVVFVHSLWDDI